VHDERKIAFLHRPRPTADILRTRGIPFETRTVHDPAEPSRKTSRSLEAVQRWLGRWKRIEPKLRSSIVEGVSVFLSLLTTTRKSESLLPQEGVYDPQRTSATVWQALAILLLAS